MAQTQRISRNNTAIYTQDDGTRQVFLHNTCIVQVKPDGTVKLDTGGWLTVTTMTRMNQVSNEWRLGYSVGRAKGKFSAWLHHEQREIESADNRTLTIPPPK